MGTWGFREAGGSKVCGWGAGPHTATAERTGGGGEGIGEGKGKGMGKGGGDGVEVACFAYSSHLWVVVLRLAGYADEVVEILLGSTYSVFAINNRANANANPNANVYVLLRARCSDRQEQE